MGRKSLTNANYLSFSTFRKSGAEVTTPVWFAEQDEQFYIFSANNAGKVKRLRNSGKSRVAACTVSGRITGDWVDADAELLSEPADIKQALAALRGKYGWQMRITDCLSTLTGKINSRAYIRVKPA